MSEMVKDAVIVRDVKILKVKKGVPTVIEVDGLKYVCQHPDDFRRGRK